MAQDYIVWLLNYPARLGVCVLGIIGNIISIFIWNRLKGKCKAGNISSAVLFITLSIVDLGVLFFSCLVDVLPSAYPVIKQTYAYIMFFIYIGHPCHFFFLFASIFTLVALSVTRARFVVCPFLSLGSGRKMPRKMVFIVFMLASACNMPSFFEYKISHIGNSTYTLHQVPYGKSPTLQMVVFISHCACGVFLPWLTTVLANVVLILKTKPRRRFSKKQVQSRSSTEYRHITVTVVITSLVSMLLLSLQCVTRCIIMFIHGGQPNYQTFKFLASLGDFAIPLFSASNFICFNFSGKSFRHELKILLGVRVENRKSQSH